MMRSKSRFVSVSFSMRVRPAVSLLGESPAPAAGGGAVRNGVTPATVNEGGAAGTSGDGAEPGGPGKGGVAAIVVLADVDADSGTLGDALPAEPGAGAVVC